jgi:polyisoprenoid-binding protein YceI
MFTLLRRRTQDFDGGPAAARGDMSLPDGAGRAECRVVDPVGLPLQAIVVLEQEGWPAAEGNTDAYGMFTAAVPPGDYRLQVACDGFQPRQVPVRVSAGAHASAGVIALSAAPLPPTPAPGLWDIDPDHTAIRFAARHIGLAEIHGRFNRFSGHLWIAERMQESRIKVYIEAGSINTGVPSRDYHLRSPDFLDVAAYPHLIFTGGNFVHRGGSRWTVTGVLELHGISGPVKLDTTYLGRTAGMEGRTRAACKAVTELHREDYNLTWQKMLPRGIRAIGTTIQIELDIQVVQASQPIDPPPGA